MRRKVMRGAFVAGLCISFAVGFWAVATPVVAGGCEQQCMRDYQRCVPFCSKNPCFVSCETVLQICLSNCGSGGGSES